jgi:hypothetical protein
VPVTLALLFTVKFTSAVALFALPARSSDTARIV